MLFVSGPSLNASDLLGVHAMTIVGGFSGTRYYSEWYGAIYAFVQGSVWGIAYLSEIHTDSYSSPMIYYPEGVTPAKTDAGHWNASNGKYSVLQFGYDRGDHILTTGFSLYVVETDNVTGQETVAGVPRTQGGQLLPLLKVYAGGQFENLATDAVVGGPWPLMESPFVWNNQSNIEIVYLSLGDEEFVKYFHQVKMELSADPLSYTTEAERRAKSDYYKFMISSDGTISGQAPPTSTDGHSPAQLHPAFYCIVSLWMILHCLLRQ